MLNLDSCKFEILDSVFKSLSNFFNVSNPSKLTSQSMLYTWNNLPYHVKVEEFIITIVSRLG